MCNTCCLVLRRKEKQKKVPSYKTLFFQLWQCFCVCSSVSKIFYIIQLSMPKPDQGHRLRSTTQQRPRGLCCRVKQTTTSGSSVTNKRADHVIQCMSKEGHTHTATDRPPSPNTWTFVAMWPGTCFYAMCGTPYRPGIPMLCRGTLRDNLGDARHSLSDLASVKGIGEGRSV